MRINFGQESHLRKQEKMFISCVRKHLICEIQLKEYCTCMMGPPVHFSRPVRDVLNNTGHDRLIGRKGRIAWPPRSPDFNHVEFYLWGHLKTVVYAAPVDKRRGTSTSHCGRLSDYPQLPWHL
jgi:hypothetical protein